MKLNLFDIDNEFLVSHILDKGDCTITLYGGHNYTSLTNDSLVYEFKTGPYEGQLKDNNTNLYQYLTQEYLSLFSTYNNFLIKSKFERLKTIKKAEISYVSQSIKDRTNKEYIVVDSDNILYQYLLVDLS